MKYCKYCGAQMNDGDAVCPSCGRAAETQPTRSARYNTGTQTAAKVFMIISFVIYALMGIIMMTVAFWVGIIYWIPLCWVVPMTVVYNNSINGMRPPVGVAFKICALLFASLIAGILMLCDNNN